MQRRHPDTNRDLIVLQITGHLFFLGLAVLSVLFWKERQAFDAAHYLFEITDRKFFFIAHQRPAGIVSQLLPVIGTWLRLPLSALAVLYSLGDILWYYLIFLCLAYQLETRRGIVALLLILSLTVRYSFYCPVTELLQAGALLPVWMSLLDRSFRFRLPVLLLTGAFIIFSHPLLFYPLLFALGWWSLQESRNGLYLSGEKTRFTALLFGMLLLITGLKLLLLDRYDHDKTFYAIEYNDYGYIHTFHAGVWWHHLKVVAAGYPFLTFIFLAAVGFLTWFRKWKSLVYVLLAVGVYVLIMSLTHRFDRMSNYFERMLLPLPMMMALVAGSMITITRAFLSRLIGFVGLFLILLMHFDLLRITAQPYTARIALLEDMCAAAAGMDIRKGIVAEDLLEQNNFAMTGWCYPLETLVLSSYAGKQHSVTIALQREHLEKNREKGDTARNGEWIRWAENNLPVAALNKDYYTLPEGEYRPLFSTDTSRVIPVSLRLQDVTPMKAAGLLLSVELTTDSTSVFMADGQTAVVLRDNTQQELSRSVLPYGFKGRGRWSFVVPIPAGDVRLVLMKGPRELTAIPLVKEGGTLKEKR